MSMFAGILARRETVVIPPDVRSQLRGALTTDRNATVWSWDDDPRAYLVSLDLAALAPSATPVRSEGAVTVVAGEPLLAPPDGGLAADHRALHDALLEDRWPALRAARGTFCAAHYRAGPTPLLDLVTDRVGVRPIYWWASDDFVVFSTALRVIEALDLVPKALDLRAVAEISALAYPLADRTPYRGVFAMYAAEVVRVDASGVHRARYWRWDEVRTSTAPEADQIRGCYQAFRDAVRRRTRGDATATAFLSGGLDSRAIVASLRDDGVKVVSFNFSPAGSQDTVLGTEFARVAGTLHASRAPDGRQPIDFVGLLATSLAESPHAGEPDRPRTAWSGDGGSVGLGHVYIVPGVVSALRRGDVDGAISAFLDANRTSIPLRFLRAPVRREVADVLRQGVREELAAIDADDPVRGFYLFLMMNDQRRHLARHFETIAENRIELQLPFFDGAFLETVAAMPAEWCLYHRAYLKWLALFPSFTTSVPWQSYPGHEPCPLPVPPGLAYQWGANPTAATPRVKRARARQQSGEFRRTLYARDFPATILHRPLLWAAAWAHWTGLRDYGYAFRAADVFREYWRRTQRG